MQELGASFKVGEIPADLMEEAQEWREKLMEQVVEMDDDAMELYLDVCLVSYELPCLHLPCFCLTLPCLGSSHGNWSRSGLVSVCLAAQERSRYGASPPCPAIFVASSACPALPCPVALPVQ